VLPTGEEDLIERLKSLPTQKIDSLFFRVLSPRWIRNLDSAEGARLHGGRFNPPYDLAQSVCKIDSGFGFLYTTSNPITCLFECKHILRGLGKTEFQILAVPPSLLITFSAESDRVLDLRDSTVLGELGLTRQDLTGLDDRAVVNESGTLTPLQRLGTAIYKVGRFSGMLTPSRYDDIIPSFCFNFLPGEVRPVVRDVEKVLDRLTFSQGSGPSAVN
jgi:RES domain